MPIFCVRNVLRQCGVISDRHGVPLAISTPIMKIVIDPRDYFDTKHLYDEITAELKRSK